MDFIRNLESSLYKGFIDQSNNSYGSYKPKLLINDKKASENVLSTLLEELDNCKAFLFSVAFITESGLATLKSHLLDLNQKGIKGRILTSTFLNFNQPKVFKELLKLTNVEVRLTNLEGFHSKGYIFEHKTHYSLIVGSSNLTAQALKVNYEWNVKLTSHENGEIVHHFNRQFEEVWEKAQALSDGWIETYEKNYVPPSTTSVPEKVADFPISYNFNPIEKSVRIEPNKMQKAALHEIQKVRESGKDKSLIISATGTGKTYLSAFDVRRFSPNRILFIVHREQILQRAKSNFLEIIGGIESEFGILSGSLKQTTAKYLFATIQTISKEDVLSQYDPKAFDYILIDEVHKAGAQSYQKVINYFKPKFLMGMTATPERTDDFNIYELFDYNVAYEIRLQEALEEDMLCPFHYFGVTDIELDGEVIDDTTILKKLVTEERISHLIDKINYYGYSGDKVRGLIFCSRREEAEQLSVMLNSKGFRTAALTGLHSQDERVQKVDFLEKGELDYILTVDIFNEGIDIPSVNQVVMLRQTQSSIIFIQQLGRGLRKHSSKEYVTIIDFIGNYRNNYLIPVALSGDRSQNKDNIRRNVKDTSYIKGVSTINFEEVAKNRVFNSINNSNLTDLRLLREAFNELKNRIGRTPQLQDFVMHSSIDPTVIVRKYTNYYQFLLKVRETESSLNEYENSVLTMLSLEVLNGKRKHEAVLLKLLIQNKKVDLNTYKQQLREENCSTEDEVIASVLNIFDLSFFNQSSKSKYGGKALIINEDNLFQFNEELSQSLMSNDAFSRMIEDVTQSTYLLSKNYSTERPLTLYKKYTRKDACKLLGWKKDESSTMYGYKVKHNTCPIFVTYHKHDEVESSVAYGDELLNQETLKWFTRSNRSLQSEEVQKIVQSQERHIDIHIFVKKDDDEGGDFYYLGKAVPDPNTINQTSMQNSNGGELPVVTMNMMLEQGIEYPLYKYLISGKA